MHVIFEPGLSDNAWPGPREIKDNAALGLMWVGEKGLLGVIEKKLGLTGSPGNTEWRVLKLVNKLQNEKNPWKKAHEHDPFGVAQSLISEYDTLWSYGFRGQNLSHTLNALINIMRDVPLGIPQRAHKALEALKKTEKPTLPLINKITLSRNLANDPIWGDILKKLENYGTKIILRKAPKLPKEPQTDLEKIKKMLQDPSENYNLKGDASFQFIESTGEIQGAEQLCSWLSYEEEKMKNTVIINPSELLDMGLNRYNLPLSGRNNPTMSNGFLQILPLIVHMAFSPPQPHIISQFLSLNIPFISNIIRRRLNDFIKKGQSISSREWMNLATYGLKIPETLIRKSIYYINKLIIPIKDSIDAIDFKDLKDRLSIFERVIEKKIHSKKYKNIPNALHHWHNVEDQVHLFRKALESMGRKTLSKSMIIHALRYIQSVLTNSRRLGLKPSLAAVQDPESITAPEDRIVWWNFDNRSTTSTTLDKTECIAHHDREALKAAGIHIPIKDDSYLPERQTINWQRPLFSAKKQLLLIYHKTDHTGRALGEHPFWKILCHRIGAQLDDKCRQATPHNLQRYDTTIWPLPQPTSTFTIPGNRINSRKKESPKGMDTMVRCPLSWVLEYKLKWTERNYYDNNSILGILYHRILARFFENYIDKDLPNLEDTWKKLIEIYDSEIKKITIENREISYRDSRHFIADCGRDLINKISSWGMKIISVESLNTKNMHFGIIEGRTDLVIGTSKSNPVALIDIKIGNLPLFREKIKEGRATQIAAYHYLLSSQQWTLSAGYYILDSMNTAFMGSFRDETEDTTNKHNDHQRIIHAPSPNDVWLNFLHIYKENLFKTEKGKINATFNTNDNNILKPHCSSCPYSSLCGQAFL